MGQTESLKKIRGLRKDIARVKTIARERELATASGTEKKYMAETKAQPGAACSRRRDGARK